MSMSLSSVITTNYKHHRLKFIQIVHVFKKKTTFFQIDRYTCICFAVSKHLSPVKDKGNPYVL